MATYHFGSFQLLEEEKQLFDGEKQISLTKRRFALLLILIQRAGEIVTKEELIAQVWGGMIVEESNISQQIYQLRQLLGDDARHQNFIETLPSIGYRFKAKVELEETEWVEKTEEAVAANDNFPKPAKGEVPSKRRQQLTVAVGVIAAVLVWIGTIVAREGGLMGKDRNLPRDPMVRPMVSLPGIKTHPAFSRDGKWVSFSLKDGGSNNFDIYLIEADQPWTHVPRRLTSHPMGESHSAWSPDNRQIAFLRLPELAEERFRLMILDIETKKEWEVGRVWGGLDWSPDGQFLAVSDNLTDGTSSGIFLLSTDGRERRPLSTPAPKENLYDFNPRFSRDGTKLIFIRAYSNLFREIFLVDLRSGALTQLTYDQRAIIGVAWTPDGQEIFFLSNRAGIYRLWRMPAKGGEAQLVEKVSTGDIGLMGADSLAISPTDQQIALGSESEDAQIIVRSLPGTIRERERPCWIQSSEWETTPNFSSDGKGLLFISDRSGREELWSASEDCTDASPLTTLEEFGIEHGTWSPDGNWVLFTRHVQQQTEIFRLNLWDRSFQRMTHHPNSDILASWSRDGRWIYFSSNRNGKHKIYRMPAAGGDPVELTREGGMMSRESFDGRTLYYTRNERLRRLDLLSGEDDWVSGLNDVNIGYSWDVGRNHLYYVPQKTPGPPVAYRYHLATGKVERLFAIDGMTSVNFQGISVNREETRIAITIINQHRGNLRIIEEWE